MRSAMPRISSASDGILAADDHERRHSDRGRHGRRIAPLGHSGESARDARRRSRLDHSPNVDDDGALLLDRRGRKELRQHRLGDRGRSSLAPPGESSRSDRHASPPNRPRPACRRARAHEGSRDTSARTQARRSRPWTGPTSVAGPISSASTSACTSSAMRSIGIRPSVTSLAPCPRMSGTTTSYTPPRSSICGRHIIRLSGNELKKDHAGT